MKERVRVCVCACACFRKTEIEFYQVYGSIHDIYGSWPHKLKFVVSLSLSPAHAQKSIVLGEGGKILVETMTVWC